MDYDKMEQDAQIIEELSAIMTSESNTELCELKESEVEEIDNETIENYPAIKEYLDSDYGSEQEQVIKKMMAAADIASGADDSPEKVASQADASAISIKTAYKVSTGELDITESTEILIDQAAARLNTFIQERLDMDSIGEKLVDVVAIAYPPAKKLEPYVKAVLKRAEPVVRKAITSGINTVATYAKKAVRAFSIKVMNSVKILLA